MPVPNAPRPGLSRRGLLRGLTAAADVRRRLLRPPQQRPRIARGRLGQRAPPAVRDRDRRFRQHHQAAAAGHQVGARAQALHGAPEAVREEARGAAQLGQEPRVLRRLPLVRQQQALAGQQRRRHCREPGQPVALRHEHAERVEAEHLGGDVRRHRRGPPDADVQPPLGQPPALLRHPGVHQVHLHVGMPAQQVVQHRPDGFVALVEHAHPQHRAGVAGALGDRRRAFDVGQDLPGLGEEPDAGRGQLDVPGGARDQPDAERPLEALHLLAQRRLDDVLAGGGPAEVQLLGQCHEVAQLPELHAGDRRVLRCRLLPGG
jgi:hypothetical protein